MYIYISSCSLAPAAVKRGPSEEGRRSCCVQNQSVGGVTAWRLCGWMWTERTTTSRRQTLCFLFYDFYSNRLYHSGIKERQRKSKQNGVWCRFKLVTTSRDRTGDNTHDHCVNPSYGDKTWIVKIYTISFFFFQGWLLATLPTLSLRPCIDQ